MGLAAAASVSYLAFDRRGPWVMSWILGDLYWFDNEGVRHPGWYYKNAYFLMLTLAPFISGLLFSIGIFFLFPENSKRAYFLSIPIALAIAKILWLLQVDRNDDYYHIVPAYFLLVAVLITGLTLFTFNWLVDRKYHRFDALCVRIVALLQARKANLLDSETCDRLLEQEAEKLKAFNQQY